MERINALIDKLCQQKDQACTPAQLLPTVQLLQSELVKAQQKNGSLGTSKVAVTMPVSLNFAEETIRPAKTDMQKVEREMEKETTAEKNKEAETTVVQQTVKQPQHMYQPSVFEEPVYKEEQPKPAPAQKHFYPSFDAGEEAPTLVQYQPKKELHELIGEQKESLNDRLKQEKVEVVHALKDTPIKDLRKGIGINDRFTFVTELFRGDEPMYERSIKTINGFHILSEAEYWMNRELKFKLGWNDNKEIVQHFYQIVRRRFS